MELRFTKFVKLIYEAILRLYKVFPKYLYLWITN